jgi:hypothetical protein
MYLVKGLYPKMLFMQFFNQEVYKSVHLFVVVFLCISAGRESYMTARRPIGLRQGRGAPPGASLLPIGHLGFIYDSQLHGYALFIAI